MISIIICSRDKNLLSITSNSIKKNIGIEHEILSIDNSKLKRGICEVYNTGAQKAKYPILCFMHEDIDIKTINWGIKVSELFSENSKIGLVGVGGCSYKTCIPSGWVPKTINKTIYSNIIQYYKADQKSIHHIHNPQNQNLSKVSCIDGLWFCTTKEIAIQMPFDELTFKGFHCYDLDFSLSVSQKYQVAVTFDILIEHFSEGNFNKEWLIETIKLHKKWLTKLPFDVEGLTQSQKNIAEQNAFYEIFYKALEFNCLDKSFLSILSSKNMRAILSLKSFTKLYFLVFRALIKKYYYNFTKYNLS